MTKILTSEKRPLKKSSLKYFTGCNDNNVIRPLCIKKLPQMIGCVKHFDINKTMYFKANKLLKKYTKIWERVSSLMIINTDSEPVCGDNDKYIKTKSHMKIRQILIFMAKNYQKKMHHTNVYHE